MTADPLEDVPRTSPYDTSIVIAGIVAIGLGAIYWVMRIGFSNPLLDVGKPVMLGLFIYSFPATVELFLFRKAKRETEFRDNGGCFLPGFGWWR